MVRDNEVEYARTQFQAGERALRTWFVAYAIGVPAILISSDATSAKLMEFSFFAGAALACCIAAVCIQICTEIGSKAATRRLLFEVMASGAPAFRQGDHAYMIARANMSRSVSIGQRLDFATFGLLLIGTAFILIHLISAGQAPAGGATSMPAAP